MDAAGPHSGRAPPPLRDLSKRVRAARLGRRRRPAAGAARLRGGGALYFAHLRSAVCDRDLDIGAELEALHQPPRPHHVVPIGPSIAWAPAYLAVAAADWIGGMTRRSTRDAGAARGLTGAYVEA